MSGTEPKSTHPARHRATITRHRREKANGHRGVVLWFTGLSGAGKTTPGHVLEEVLFERGYHTIVLDEDNIHHGLCGNHGISNDDRQENIRRIPRIAKLFVETGHIVMTTFISPFQEDHDNARRFIGKNDFVEIYCIADIETCKTCDSKGVYERARRGVIPLFTDITSPYEAPINPTLEIKTDQTSLNDSVKILLQCLQSRNIIPPTPINNNV